MLRRVSRYGAVRLLPRYGGVSVAFAADTKGCDHIGSRPKQIFVPMEILNNATV